MKAKRFIERQTVWHFVLRYTLNQWLRGTGSDRVGMITLSWLGICREVGVGHYRFWIWTIRNCFSSLNCSSGATVIINPECKSTENNHTFFIVMETLQEIKQLLLVSPKNTFDLRRFLRICNKHLLSIHIASEGWRRDQESRGITMRAISRD